MTWKDLRAPGETERRLCSLHAWRECPCCTQQERSVLAWSEAVTVLVDKHMPDAIVDEVCRVLGE